LLDANNNIKLRKNTVFFRYFARTSSKASILIDLWRGGAQAVGKAMAEKTVRAESVELSREKEGSGGRFVDVQEGLGGCGRV